MSTEQSASCTCHEATEEELLAQLDDMVLLQLKENFKRLKVVFADSAYGRNALPDWVKGTFGWVLQTVLRPVGIKGFVILMSRRLATTKT